MPGSFSCRPLLMYSVVCLTQSTPQVRNCVNRVIMPNVVLQCFHTEFHMLRRALPCVEGLQLYGCLTVFFFYTSQNRPTHYTHTHTQLGYLMCFTCGAIAVHYYILVAPRKSLQSSRNQYKLVELAETSRIRCVHK